MTLTRQHNLEEAKDWMVRLDCAFRANAVLRHLDANIEIEVFFRDFLNELFGWSLQSSNWSGQMYQDSFDLDDRSSRVAVQVTTTMTAKKIRNTFATFLSKHRGYFDRLLFVYPFVDKTSSSANFADLLNGFSFDPARDRLSLGDLLQAMQSLPVDGQSRALDLLRQELRPLGAALRLGVDQNVEAIIRIIEHISSGYPTTTVESNPDASAKLRRFAVHADYLTRQYTLYVDCHRAVAEAREAVGYDAARALRCAAWLKERSLDALDSHGGNARLAFDGLVDLLRDQLHQQGSDCEDSAMRYFLADEIGRCNVFPNPAEAGES